MSLKCRKCRRIYRWDVDTEFPILCNCGYIIEKDYQIQDNVKINWKCNDINMLVSTMLINNDPENPIYETAIFSEYDKLYFDSDERFSEKEDAIEYHNMVIEKLKNGNFTIEKDEDDYYDSYNLTLLLNEE